MFNLLSLRTHNTDEGFLGININYEMISVILTTSSLIRNIDTQVQITQLSTNSINMGVFDYNLKAFDQRLYEIPLLWFSKFIHYNMFHIYNQFSTGNRTSFSHSVSCEAVGCASSDVFNLNE